jgi:TatA/E family protein of Tat protein translocase
VNISGQPAIPLDGTETPPGDTAPVPPPGDAPHQRMQAIATHPAHLLLVAIVATLCFGPKRLPELGRSLGSGLRGFRATLDGQDDEAAPKQLE